MIQIASAIIIRPGDNGEHQVLTALRSYNSRLMPLRWHTPGGKVEQGETLEECLHRELEEELGLVVFVGKEIANHTTKYSEGEYDVHFFRASIARSAMWPTGTPMIRTDENQKLEWKTYQQLWHPEPWIETNRVAAMMALLEYKVMDKL